MEVKPGYKKTEAGVIPKDWEAVSLGSFVALQRGYDLTWRHRRAGNVPVMGSAGPNGFHDTSIAKGPGVVVGRSGASFGKAHYCEHDFWPHNTVLYVTDFYGNNPLFVFYLLTSLDFSSYNSGGAQQSLNRNFIASIVVGVPRLQEQHAIATALSEVDALLRSLDHLIDKKRDIKRGAMQQLLTGQTRLPGFHDEWEMKRVGDFTTCTAGGTPSTSVPHYWDGPIRWMSSGELNLKYVHDVAGRITEAGLKSSSAKMLPPRCVLIGLAGQGKTRGTSAMNLVSLCTNQSIAAIFPGDSFVSEYLYFNFDARYDELRELSAGDGGRGGLNLRLIKSIAVPFPSIPEQSAIAAVLSEIDTELMILELRREKTRALKLAMMQELLTGKTRLIPPGGSHG